MPLSTLSVSSVLRMAWAEAQRQSTLKQEGATASLEMLTVIATLWELVKHRLDADSATVAQLDRLIGSLTRTDSSAAR